MERPEIAATSQFEATWLYLTENRVVAYPIPHLQFPCAADAIYRLTVVDAAPDATWTLQAHTTDEDGTVHPVFQWDHLTAEQIRNLWTETHPFVCVACPNTV